MLWLKSQPSSLLTPKFNPDLTCELDGKKSSGFYNLPVVCQKVSLRRNIELVSVIFWCFFVGFHEYHIRL